MKVVLQRVAEASVNVDNRIVGAIDKGLLLLIGVEENDTKEDIDYVANKCVNLRIFEDEQNKMNRSLLDIKGAVLAISQFTLLADTRKGRRPSFIRAANLEKGEALYGRFVDKLREEKVRVETGIFGAMMDVRLVNYGPVTIIVESKQ